MNSSTVKAFAKWLATLPPKQYDQGTFGRITDCGTAACMAGNFCIWRGLKLRPSRGTPIRYMAKAHSNAEGVDPYKYAKDGLGLSKGQAWLLFNSLSPYNTPKKAVKALLRELAEEV